MRNRLTSISHDCNDICNESFRNQKIFYQDRSRERSQAARNLAAQLNFYDFIEA